MTQRVEADALRLNTDRLGNRGKGFAYGIDVEHRAKVVGKDEALVLVAVAVTHLGQRLLRPVPAQRVGRQRIKWDGPGQSALRRLDDASWSRCANSVGIRRRGGLPG